MMLIIRSTINRMRKNPLRTTLTITNIALGVAIITLIFNISLRLNEKVRGNSIKDINRIVIANAKYNTGPEPQWADPPQFRVEDGRIIKNSIDSISYVSPLNVLPPENRIKIKETLYHTREFLGVGKEYSNIYGLKIIAGRFITQKDTSEKRNVAVISQSVARILFTSPQKAVGKTFVDIRRNRGNGKTTRRIFKIVGVFADIPQTKAKMYGISDFLIPYSIYNSAGNNRVRVFVAKTTTTNLKKVTARIKNLLTKLHGYSTEITVWAGNPRNPEDPRLRDMKEMSKMITLFMAPLGMIVLLVSAFGIFSVMMVSILENIREIGLHRTLGATRIRIISHFLTEAFILSLIGSLVGIAIAQIFNSPVINAVKPLIGGPAPGENISFSLSLDPRSIGLSFAIAQLLGVLFALFPASSAARISPIESLREG